MTDFSMTDNLKLICKRLYELSGKNISNLVLQKLLYLIQAYSLIDDNQPGPAFTDTIEAWQYGPVVPKAYYGFKYNLDEIQSVNTHNLDSTIARRIDEIYNTFGSWDPFDLVKLTHSYDSWINAWRNPVDSKITIESIRDCHIKLRENQNYIF